MGTEKGQNTFSLTLFKNRCVFQVPSLNPERSLRLGHLWLRLSCQVD